MESKKRMHKHGAYYIQWILTGTNQEGYWKVYDSQMRDLGLRLEDGELERGLREYEEA